MITILVGLSIGAFLVSAQVTSQPVTSPTGSPATTPTSVPPVAHLEDNGECFSDDIRNACQPGSYVCHVDGRTECCWCPDETFQPAFNECPSCVTCRDCKELNKRTAVMCNITQDTVCGKKLPPPTTIAPIQVLTEDSSETPAVIEDRTSSPCEDYDCSTCCPPQQCTQNETRENTTASQDCDCTSEFDGAWWRHPIAMLSITVTSVLATSIVFVIFPDLAAAPHDTLLEGVNYLRLQLLDRG